MILSAFLPLASLAVISLFAMMGAAAAPNTVRGSSLTARIGLGFALFPLIVVAPLYFTTSFLPSALIAIALAAVGTRKIRLTMPKTTAEKLFWVAVAANLLLLSYGTARNAGLGDHDPYEHAMAVSYLFETGSLIPAPHAWMELSTLDPYPPGYDASAAALSKAFGSVALGLRVWAIVCAGMFPVAVRFFTRSIGLGVRSSAVAGAVAVLLTPAPTHFAWTHTLGISLTLIAVASLALTLQHRRWTPVAGLALAALGLSATSDIIYSAVLLVPVAWRVVVMRKGARLVTAMALSILIASPWIFHFAARTAETGLGKPLGHWALFREHYDSPDARRSPWHKQLRGNARPYEMREFLAPFWSNYFNIPVGLPAAAFIPALAGLALWGRRKGVWWPVWGMMLMLVAVQGERLPVEFFPHRAWTYLAVFTALGFAVFMEWIFLRKVPSRQIKAALVVVALLSFGHSTAVRARMELVQWGNEVFTGTAQRDGYYGLLKILNGEKTYPFTGGIRYGYVPAMGGRVTFWEDKELAADDLVSRHKFAEALAPLREAGYRYFVLDATLDIRLGEGAMVEARQALAARTDLRLVLSGEGFALFVANN